MSSSFAPAANPALAEADLKKRVDEELQKQVDGADSAMDKPALVQVQVPVKLPAASLCDCPNVCVLLVLAAVIIYANYHSKY